MINLSNSDIYNGLKKKHIWFNIAKTEIKFKFKRTKLGPFWITIGTAIFIVVLSVVTGAFFADDLGVRVPYITTGLIIWSLIFSSINESSGVFSGRVGLIQNIPMEKSILIYVMMTKSVITFLFNFILYIFCLILFKINIGLNSIFFILGFFILTLSLFFFSSIVSILTTRFRDLAPITSSILTVLFFLTPVWWNVEYFPDRALFAKFNIFFHYLEITRKPLLGELPGLNSWIITSITLIFLAIIASYLFEKKKNKIAYWA